MTFAPEDKRAWETSKVMAELEKVALREGILDGPPPEAFEPLPAKEAEESSSWEEEPESSAADQSEPLGVGEINGLTLAVDDAKAGLKALAVNLAAVQRVAEAHRLERALLDIGQMGDSAEDVMTRLARLIEDLDSDGHSAIAEAVDRQADALFRRAIIDHADEEPQKEEGDAPHQA